MDVDTRNLAKCAARVGETIEAMPVEFDDVSHDNKSDALGDVPRTPRCEGGAGGSPDGVEKRLSIDLEDGVDGVEEALGSTPAVLP